MCLGHELRPALQSFSSPVLVEKRNRLLGIDGAGRKVVSIDLSPPMAGSVEVIELSEDRSFVSFAQAGDELVQVHGDGRGLGIAWFDEHLKLVQEKYFGEEDVKHPGARSSARRLLAPYQWIWTQSHLVGYGAVSSDEVDQDDYWLGFFDQPMPAQGSEKIPSARLFQSFANPNFYLLGHPYLVARGSEVFFLEMGQYPTLFSYDIGLGLSAERIDGFPGENRKLNDPLTSKLSLRQHGVLMERLDQFEGPWGLYQHRGELYMLERSLDGSSVEWHLHHLNIKDRHIESANSLQLPTRASQIVLVSSTDGKWLILEQTIDDSGVRKLSRLKICRFNSVLFGDS